MPVTKAAKKALKRSRKLRERNLVFIRSMKQAIRDARQKYSKGDKLTEDDMKKAYSTIDRALKRNVIHKNNAARKKSRLMKMFHKSVA